MTTVTVPAEILAKMPEIDPALLTRKLRQGFAWMEPSGRIRVGVGHRMAKGSRIIAIGPRRSMRNLFQVVARHGYDPGVILVPGVPEAATIQDAEDALLDWLDWLAKHERPDIHLIDAGLDKAGRSTSEERFNRTAAMFSGAAVAKEG